MKFVVIAVPGVVAPGYVQPNPVSSDGSEILRAVGGKDSLRSTLKREGSGKPEFHCPEQLVLKFGVDSTSSFVRANSLDSTPCKLVAKTRTWKSGRRTVEILGPVVSFFSFSQPADFLHLSLQPVVAGELVGPAMATESPRIPPPIFTKIDSIDNLFGKSQAGSGAAKPKKYGSGAIFSAVARYEDAGVPSGHDATAVLPAPGTAQLNPQTLCSWRRSKSCSRGGRSGCVAPSTSFCPRATRTGRRGRRSRGSATYTRVGAANRSDGPWRGCMCRLGYDPRRDIRSRFYQTIDFRDPHYRTISWKAGRTQAASSDEFTTDSALDREKVYGELAGDVVKPNPEVHFLVPPNRPSQLYQLADICDAGIQNIVNSADQEGVLTAECSKATGWYSAQALSKIRNMMVVKCLRMRHQHNAKP